MTEQKINVGLVEDQFLFRQGMRAILSAWPDIDVVFESADGYSVIDKLKDAKNLPHVMLVDLSLPPNGNKVFTGRDVTTALAAHYPDIKVIILSGHSNENFIAQLIEHGAHGYLIKECDPQEVYEAIRSAYFKGSYINSLTLKAIRNNMEGRAKSKILTKESLLSEREIEVLQLICLQHTTEEIAEKLFISPKTVNSHRINLLQKTGTKNVAGLVVYAMKNGIAGM